MSILVIGDVFLRATSVDPKRIQVMMPDGVTPFDLTNAIDIELRLENTLSGAFLVFKESVGQVVREIPHTSGIIVFTALATDFLIPALFKYYTDIIDADGRHSVPESDDLAPFWTISKKIGG